MDNETPEQRILAACTAVLINGGLNGFTVDAVASEAGMSKGGVLHHFRTKQDLVEALVKEGCIQWISDYYAQVRQKKKSGSRMPHVYAIIAEGLQINSPSDEDASMKELFLMIHELNRTKPELAEESHKVYKLMLRDMMADGLTEGQALFVASAVDGVLLWTVAGMCPLTKQQRKTHLQAVLDYVGAIEAASGAGKPV